MSGMPPENKPTIQTYVFFDLETTGFIQGTSMPKITEISLVASSRDSLFLNRTNDTLPRVNHKLTIPIQPMRLVPLKVSQITGLYNDLLEHEKPFDEQVYELLNAFIGRLCPPICFVAHNGNRFDYPVLLSELNRIGKSFTEDILCVDSLLAFQTLLKPTFVKSEIVDMDSTLLEDGCDEAALAAVVDSYTTDLADVDRTKNFGRDRYFGFVDETDKLEAQPHRMQKANETTPTHQINGALDPRPRKPFIKTEGSTVKKTLSFTPTSPANFKLETVYTHLVGSAPLNSHSAEGDCISLLVCVMKIGDPFVRWADNNASPMIRYAKRQK